MREITYELLDFGRPAVFMIPANKLTEKLKTRILKFLREKYGGSTMPVLEPKIRVKMQGEWVDSRGLAHIDENYEFEVSFLGSHRIPELCQFLAEIGHEIDEEVIYAKFGEETRGIKVKATDH